MSSHLLKRELPEVKVLRCQIDMSLRNLSSSIVTKPNIVSLLGEHKCRGFIEIVHKPHKRIRTQTMHHQNDLSIILFSLDSIQTKNVSIISGYLIVLSSHIVLFDNLLEVMESIVHTCGASQDDR